MYTMYSGKQLETIHLQDSYTIMYALLARQIIEELGALGDEIVRESTRRYGRDRGRKRRQKHLDLGVKINMHSFFAVCSDLPPDPRFRRDRLLLTEEERNSHTLVCPMAQVWEEYGAKKNRSNLLRRISPGMLPRICLWHDTGEPSKNFN